jgi:hypothetical protein
VGGGLRFRQPFRLGHHHMRPALVRKNERPCENHVAARKSTQTLAAQGNRVKNFVTSP